MGELPPDPAKAGLGFWGLVMWYLAPSIFYCGQGQQKELLEELKDNFLPFKKSCGKIYWHRLNMCPLPPKFMCWNLILLWRHLEVGPSWMGLLPYKRDSREIPQTFCVRLQPKHSHLWTREWAVTRHRIYQCLDLGFPSLQNCDNYISIYGPPCLWYFIIATWTG